MRNISIAAFVLLTNIFPCTLLAETDAVIDFQSLEIIDNNVHSWGNMYEEDGFRIQSDQFHNLLTFGTFHSWYPGSTAMFTTGALLTPHIELAHVTGAPFNLHSIDIAKQSFDGPATVNFTGYLAGGGIVTASFTTSSPFIELETFEFPLTFRGLEAVRWNEETPFHQFDNIRVSTVDTIIDFQSLEIEDAATHGWGDFHYEDGFGLYNFSGLFEFKTFGTLEPRYPGSTALFNGAAGGETVLWNLTNQAFDLLSIDISNLNVQGPVSVTFAGTKHCSGGTVTASFTTSGSTNKLETFVFPETFRGLAFVEWAQDSPYHQFDNIRVLQSDTIVDFQSLEVVGNSFSTWGDFYEEDGYQLTTPDINGFGTWETMSFGYAGSTALFNNLVGGLTVLASENSGPFNLISIEVANFFNAGPVTVEFVGRKVGGGTVNASYTTSGPTNVLETFVLPETFRDLQSVEWFQEEPFHQFDNIRLSQEDTYIDFQGLAIDDSNTHIWDEVYEENDFRLVNLSQGQFFTFGIQEPRYAGSTALFDLIPNRLARLESVSHEPFDLFSMDIANLNNDGPSTVSFIGFVESGGTVTASYTTSSPDNVLETCVFPDSFRSLLFVEWAQGTPSHQFDNIRVSISDIFVAANSYTEFRGTHVSGDLESTTESDDEYLKYNPGLVLSSVEAPVWLIFDGNLPACDTLQLIVEAQAGTPGLTATLEALNWNTGAYDIVDVSATSFNNDQVVSVDLSDGIGNYVETGSRAVRARIGWRKTGLAINFPWEVRLDQIGWKIN